MVSSKAKTVAEYLASLPAERRAVIDAVRKTILAHLDRGYEEGMGYGMITYHVPHSLYPAGYHCNPQQPLPYVTMAAQKNHFAVYMFGLYCDHDAAQQFEREWKATGKKLDMGKCCVRFKRVEDVPLDVLGAAVARQTVARFVGSYEALLSSTRGGRVGKEAVKKPAKAPAKKTVRKAPAKKPVAKAASAPKRAASKGVKQPGKRRIAPRRA